MSESLFGEASEGSVADRLLESAVLTLDRLTSSPKPFKLFCGFVLGLLVCTGVPDRLEETESAVILTEEDVLLLDREHLSEELFTGELASILTFFTLGVVVLASGAMRGAGGSDSGLFSMRSGVGGAVCERVRDVGLIVAYTATVRFVAESIIGESSSPENNHSENSEQSVHVQHKTCLFNSLIYYFNRLITTFVSSENKCKL